MSFRDRLERRAKRRNWSADKLASKIQGREELRANTKGALGKIVGSIAVPAISALPGGAIVGSVLNQVPGLSKVPIVDQITNEAQRVLTEEMAGHSKFVTFIRDLIPLVRLLEGLWDWIEDNV